ncbi:MAG: mechanosensitive ion channel protein MscL [Gammaproteobacteria bacterium RBG_16_57_12]|nr:MAG: mechanosensitive ion channel protein MscL [Gammaproteobacteria bacterium RBG_16_57_12]
MIEEFKKFALKGNVVDMAVGIIIGAAFGKIVSSLVGDVLMPPIGMLVGNVDFSQLYVNLSSTTYESLAKAQEAGAPVIKYGAFINTLLDFVIVAFAIFMAIKALNTLRKKEKAAPAAAPSIRKCTECLSEIPIAARRCAHCASPQS